MYGTQQNSASADSFSRIRQNNNEHDYMSPAFTKLMSNKDFALAFSRTFMDIANYNFDTEKTTAEVNKFTKYKEPVTDTYKRFSFTTQGESKFQQEANTVASFYNSRFDNAVRTLNRAASLSNGLNSVTVQNDTSKGSVKLNTLTLNEESWTGKYHSDYDMTATAEPLEGAEFDHWEISGAELTSGSKTSQTISFKAAGNVTVKVVYSGGVSILRGDYNNDGSVGVADLTTLNKYVLGQKVNIVNADMVKDGRIDTFDLAALRKEVIG
jgi:hypothetical protein